METHQGQTENIENRATQNSPILFGLGAFGLETAFKVFAGFYMFYYVDELGLAVAMVAIINIVYAIWDAVNDPLVGFLSDNTRSRWGRRRPWLITSLPLYIGTLVLVYAVPEPFRHGKALFWYAMVIFFLFEASYTVMSVNYSALFPELFQNFTKRARAGTYYQGFSMFGELVGFTIPPIIYSQFGFVTMAMSLAGISGLVLLFSISKQKEDPKAIQIPPQDLKSVFNDVFKDRPFWLFSIGLTFLTFTTSVYTIAIPFWVKYTLGAKPITTSLIFLVVFIVAIISTFGWGRLVTTIGIKRSWFCAIGVWVVAASIVGLATDLVLGSIGAAIAGLALAGIKVCREMIMANFIDQNLERTERRQEGMYYSLLRVIGKSSKLLEAFALFLLGALFGYVSGENPGQNPDIAFRFLIGVFTLVSILIAGFISLGLSFDNKLLKTQPD